MARQSYRRIRQKDKVSEDVLKVRSLIILLVIVVLVSVGLYFLTDTMIKKEANKNNEEVSTEINYDIATIGTMFNRIESEYYVLLYSNEEDGSDLNSVLDSYRSSDNYVKTYYVDLDNKFNSSVLGSELEKTPKSSEEVKVNGATLYKMVEGKVTECISGIEEITKKLES